MKRIDGRPKDRIDIEALKKSSAARILMSDSPKSHSGAINAEDAAKRWEQSLSLVTTFAQIWMSNPLLAKQAGRKVEEFAMPLAEVQKRHANDLR